MDSLGIAVTVLAVSLLWVAAVVFGRDSRDGRDWRLGSSDRHRPFRPED